MALCSSLRVVLLVVSVLSVASVAVCTFFVSYFIAFDAINTAAYGTVSSVARMASSGLDNLLSPMVTQVPDYLSEYLASSPVIGPDDDPWPLLSSATDAMEVVFLSLYEQYAYVGFLLPAGEYVLIYRPCMTCYGYLYAVDTAAGTGASCGGTVTKRYFNVTTNIDVVPPQAAASGIFEPAENGCPLLLPPGLGGSSIGPHLAAIDIPTPRLVLYMAFPVSLTNMSSAQAVIAAGFDQIQWLLEMVISVSFAGDILVVDPNGFVAASTVAALPTTTADPAPGLLCLSYNASSQLCLFDIDSYGYEPAVLARNAGLFEASSYSSPSTVSSVLVETQFPSADRFASTVLVAVTQLSPSSGLAKFYLAIFIPGSVVHGDLHDFRVIIIAVAAAVTSLSLLCTALVIACLFRPFHRASNRAFQVAARMRTTHSPFQKENKKAPNSTMSRIKEVRDLDTATRRIESFYCMLPAFVPADVLEALVLEPLALRPSSSVKCAVMAADFTGFGIDCYGLTMNQAESLCALLYTAVSTAVRQTRGTLIHFTGDGFLATWGDREPLPNFEVRAALAALLVYRATRVESMMRAFVERNEVPVVHIGLHCGHISVGLAACGDRFIQRLLGDVNTQAERLKCRAALFDTRPLVSEPLAKRLGRIFVQRQLLFPVEIDTDVQTVMTRRKRTSTLMAAMRVVRAFELAGITATELPDDVTRLRLEDDEVNQRAKEGHVAIDHCYLIESRSVCGGEERGGAYATARLLDTFRRLTEWPLEPTPLELSIVKAYNQASRAFLRGRFTTAIRRVVRMTERLGVQDNPFAETLQLLLTMASLASADGGGSGRANSM